MSDNVSVSRSADIVQPDQPNNRYQRRRLARKGADEPLVPARLQGTALELSRTLRRINAEARGIGFNGGKAGRDE